MFFVLQEVTASNSFQTLDINETTAQGKIDAIDDSSVSVAGKKNSTKIHSPTKASRVDLDDSDLDDTEGQMGNY